MKQEHFAISKENILYILYAYLIFVCFPFCSFLFSKEPQKVIMETLENMVDIATTEDDVEVCFL